MHMDLLKPSGVSLFTSEYTFFSETYMFTFLLTRCIKQDLLYENILCSFIGTVSSFHIWFPGFWILCCAPCTVSFLSVCLIDVQIWHSLVTAVPLPGVAWPAGEEVGCPLVLHSLGEPQQHSGVVVSNAGPVGWAAGANQRESGYVCRRNTQRVLLIYGHSDITEIVFHATSSPPIGAAAPERKPMCHSRCVNKCWVEEKKGLGEDGCLG